MRSTWWIEDRVSVLTQLWTSRQFSFSQIADRMNLTRNAVIGKAHRLGLNDGNGGAHVRTPTKKKNLTPEEAEAAKRRKQERRKERRHAMAIFFGPVNRARPPRVRPVVCEQIVPLHLTLVDLEPHQCRWPYGNKPYTFCGLDQYDGSSYCPSHFLANLRSVNRD